MKVDENMWSFFQNHLGYNDAELLAPCGLYCGVCGVYIDTD